MGKKKKSKGKKKGSKRPKKGRKEKRKHKSIPKNDSDDIKPSKKSDYTLIGMIAMAALTVLGGIGTFVFKYFNSQDAKGGRKSSISTVSVAPSPARNSSVFDSGIFVRDSDNLALH